MFLSPAFCWSCFSVFGFVAAMLGGGGRKYYRKMIAPEYLKHTTTRAPGASRLHGPQSNIAHALPSDLPRRWAGGGTEDGDNGEDIHEDLKAGYEAATARACPTACVIMIEPVCNTRTART